jgi:hypothetical protein
MATRRCRAGGAVVALLLGLTVATVRGETVNLSLLAPMTVAGASGPSSCTNDVGKWTGQQCLLSPTSQGALVLMGLLAQRDFNARNGRLVAEFGGGAVRACNVTLNIFQLLDDAYSADVAVRSTIDMIRDPTATHAVLGPSTSGASVPTALINGALDTPQLSYQATSTALDNSALYRRFLRTVPSDGDVAAAICTYWRSLSYRHVAVLFINDPYGQAFKEAIVTSCTAQGVDDVRTFPFDQNAASVRAQVRKMAESGVRVFLLVSLTQLLSDIVDEANTLGLFRDSMWVVSDGVQLDEIRALPEPLRRAFNGTLQVLSAGGSAANPAWRAFESTLEDLGLHGLDSEVLTASVRGWPDAWSTFGNIFSSLSGGEAAKIPDVVNPGAFLYDAVAAVGLAACNVSARRPALLPGAAGYGSALYGALLALPAFQGLSGQVQFNAHGGRNASTATYVMNSVFVPPASRATEQVRFVQIGASASKAGWVFSTTPVYNGGALTPPRDVIAPAEERNLANKTRVTLWAMGTLNEALALAALVWTLAHRNHFIVRASQVPFLACLCLGVMLSSSAIFIVTVDDRADGAGLAYRGAYAVANVACTAAVFVYSMGFTVTFGALYSRIWRIRRLFDNAGMRAVKVPSLHLVGIVASLLFVDVLLLTIFTATKPLTFVRTMTATDSFLFPTESQGRCDLKSQAAFFCTIGAFHVLVLLGGNYIAWTGRRINSNFSEGRFVAIAMVSYLQVLLIGVPVLIIVEESAVTEMFVQGSIVFLNDLTLLLLLFGPKLLAVHFNVRDTSGQGGEIVEQFAEAHKSSYPGNSSNVTDASPVRTGIGRAKQSAEPRRSSGLGDSTAANAGPLSAFSLRSQSQVDSTL